MVIKNLTNGNINGVRFGINNTITFISVDGNNNEFSLDVTENEFVKSVKNVYADIDDDFLKKIYNFKNGR